jgi:hypothetical protein
MKSSIEVVMLPHLVDIIEVESKPLVGDGEVEEET